MNGCIKLIMIDLPTLFLITILQATPSDIVLLDAIYFYAPQC